MWYVKKSEHEDILVKQGKEAALIMKEFYSNNSPTGKTNLDRENRIFRNAYLLAERLTGEKKENIKVIYATEDSNGYISATIEIDGYRECIHEYHN